MLGRAAIVAGTLALAASLTGGPALAHRSARGRAARSTNRTTSCAAHHRGAISVTRRVVVYSRRAGFDEYGGPRTRYFACRRPTGKPVRVGAVALSDGEYPGNQVMSRPRIAGDLVAVASGTGFASQAACYKFAGNDCADVPVWWVEVVDAQTRHRLRIATGSAAVGSLVITRSRAGGASAAGAASAAESASTPGGTSRAGAAAWIQGTGSGETLRATILLRDSRGRLTASPQTLDTGALGDSLRFTGFTLHWTNAGQPKSATLG